MFRPETTKTGRPAQPSPRSALAADRHADRPIRLSSRRRKSRVKRVVIPVA
jgi:hypothetical protein